MALTKPLTRLSLPAKHNTCRCQCRSCSPRCGYQGVAGLRAFAAQGLDARAVCLARGRSTPVCLASFTLIGTASITPPIALVRVTASAAVSIAACAGTCAAGNSPRPTCVSVRLGSYCARSGHDRSRCNTSRCQVLCVASRHGKPRFKRYVNSCSSEPCCDTTGRPSYRGQRLI